MDERADPDGPAVRAVARKLASAAHFQAEQIRNKTGDLQDYDETVETFLHALGQLDPELVASEKAAIQAARDLYDKTTGPAQLKALEALAVIVENLN